VSEQWHEMQEAGSALGIRFLAWVAGVLGRRVLQIVLLPVAGYFLLARGESRRASRAFLTRALGRRPGYGEIFRHFYTFARVIADRFYFLTGNTSRIPVRVHGAERLQALVDQGRGGIALSAHLGSFEAARVLAAQLNDVVLRTVLDRKVNRNLVEGLEAVNPDFGEAIIDLNQPPATLALQISEALQRGEWIGFLSDRSRGGDKTDLFDFMGDPARFPTGPVTIAGIYGVPLICVFPLYLNGRYEIYCEVLSEAAHMPRAERAVATREYMGRFVTELEKQAHAGPYNWFNFYDFWAQE
jgi:predicted LPLAT superfamily acyltransferase